MPVRSDTLSSWIRPDGLLQLMVFPAFITPPKSYPQTIFPCKTHAKSYRESGERWAFYKTPLPFFPNYHPLALPRRWQFACPPPSYTLLTICIFRRLGDATRGEREPAGGGTLPRRARGFGERRQGKSREGEGKKEGRRRK